MSDIRTIIAKLRAAGLDADSILSVVEDIGEMIAGVRASGGSPVDETAERRRAYDRERKAKLRAFSGGKSGGIPPEVHSETPSPPDGPLPSPAPQPSPLNPPAPSADSGRKRAIALPAGWTVGERGSAFAKQRGMSPVEISEEADRFRSHHEARGTTMKDWDAAWRTWVMSPYRQKSQRGPPAGRVTNADLMRQYAEELRDKHEPAEHRDQEGRAGDGFRGSPVAGAPLFERPGLEREFSGQTLDLVATRSDRH